MVGRYASREDDTAACALVAELARDGLGAEKGAGEIHVVGSAPFVGGHVDGVGAADYTGEAEECGD